MVITLGDAKAPALLGVLYARYGSKNLQLSQCYNGPPGEWEIKIEFSNKDGLDVEEFISRWCKEQEIDFFVI